MNRRDTWRRVLATGITLVSGGAARTPPPPRHLYDPVQRVLTSLGPDNVYRTVTATQWKTYSLRDGSAFTLDGMGGVRWLG
jgi:hypothetical protein